jgi:vacuolar-type H+-ATPase subunit I/STV1
MKDTFDAINSDQDGQKDKKIIDLAKKNRGL